MKKISCRLISKHTFKYLFQSQKCCKTEEIYEVEMQPKYTKSETKNETTSNYHKNKFLVVQKLHAQQRLEAENRHELKCRLFNRTYH